jgi:RNA polymerase sigma factor (sigma-70 family)
MPNSPASTIIEHVRKVVLQADGGGQTDGQLLSRFIDARDEMAFESLVRRHGPMVLGVCRRLLGHAHDAEDAFQATFLVLARKAASVMPREAVGNWLYGVAYHTALKAQAAAARRRAKERQVNVMPEPQVAQKDLWEELLPLLDRELSRLPDKYRLPAVLCDLEGRSRREVALQLKIPEGTLSSRLTTARRTLARRLRQHGVALAGGALATALSNNATAASLPGSLVHSTVEAAILFTAPEAAAAVSSAGAAVLAEGVLKTMFLSKLKLATVFVLAAFGLAAVTGGPVYHSLSARGSEIEKADEQRKEDPGKKPPAATEDDADQRRIKGSGKAVTKEMDLADFTAVDVRSVFRIEITQADKFRTAITADDNLFPYIKVVKEGSTLRISLDTKEKSISAKTLKATITMPALEAVTLGGASQVTFKGFKSAKRFKAKVTSASRLNGEIEADQLNLDAIGAGRATLKGSAKKARISATQASSLRLDDFTLDQADVTLKDASTATVHVKVKLDYELSGASRLVYRGDPAIGKHERSGASTVSRKPAAQGKKRASSTLTFPHDEAAFRDHLRSIHANLDHLRDLHERTDHLKRMHGFVRAAAENTLPADSARQIRLSVGDKVPDFSLKDLDGKTLKLSDLQKDVKRTKKGIVLLSFWCSFCPSCRRVEHRLDRLAKDYQGQALVMALDASAGETAKRVSDAAKKEGLSLPIVLDPPGHTADIFGTEATTTTVVIDGEGVLRYCGRFNDGERTYAEDALKAVLARKEVAVKTTRHDGCRIVRK